MVIIIALGFADILVTDKTILYNAIETGWRNGTNTVFTFRVEALGSVLLTGRIMILLYNDIQFTRNGTHKLTIAVVE